MRNSHILLTVIVALGLLGAPPVQAQVDTAWVRLYKYVPTAYSVATDVAVDEVGNVYVTGISCSSGGLEDFATIKYSPAGDTLWVRRYDGPAHLEDEAYDLELDDAGNVYVTGGGAADSTGCWDCVIIKYGPNGEQRWVARYDGPAHDDDWANDVEVDHAGNVYVTGTSVTDGDNSDIVTIKYNSEGVEQWVSRHGGPEGLQDEANALVVDDLGNVYVTGVENRGQRPDMVSNLVTIKYGPTGDTSWVSRHAGPGTGLDEGYDILVDNTYNVYVTGTSRDTQELCVTLKYRSDGETLWVRTYCRDYQYLNQCGSALAQDDAGNLYVGGRCAVVGNFNDFLTIKYRPDGETLWVRTYNGPTGYSADWVNDIALDNQGNVYVTGMSEQVHPYGQDDIATIKYDPDGNQMWLTTYHYESPVSGDDEAYAVAVDNSGYVYVTGVSGNASYATIKHRQSGAIAEGPLPKVSASTLHSTIVRGVLWQGTSDKRQATGQLLDIGGRKVLDLKPGSNDISRLAPGVYFVREPADNREPTRKVAVRH